MSGYSRPAIKLIVSLLFLAPLNIYAQQATIEHLDTEDGLAANVVYAMTQDRRGFLWFGTVFGLSKFDGHTFKTYRHDPTNPNSISDNRIYDIVEDDDGIFWIGTENGINRFDPNTESFKTFQYDPNDPSSLGINDINVLFLDGDQLWVGTLGGGLNLFNLKTESFKRFNIAPDVPGGVSDERVSDITRDHEGRLWIATMGGGLNYLNESDSTFSYIQHEPGNPNSLNSDFINALLVDSAGSFWVGTNKGLAQFNPETLQFTPVPLETINGQDANITDMMMTADGDIFISTGGDGLFLMDPQSGTTTWFQHQSATENGLASNEVEFVYQSSEGLLWVGTFNGVNRMQLGESRFKVFTPAPLEGLVNGHIRTMSWLDNTLWIGTGGGLQRYHTQLDQFIPFDRDFVLRYPVLRDFTWTVLPENDGTFWVGTDNGLSRLHPDTGLLHYVEYHPDSTSGLNDNSVRSLARARDGRLWVGTLAGGLHGLKDTNDPVVTYQYDPEAAGGLSNNEIRIIHEAPEGILWLGTWGGGLNRFDTKTDSFTVFQHNPQDSTSIANNVIWSITESSDGTLWLGTDAGLNRVNIPPDGNLRNITFTQFRDPDRLESISGIVPVLEDDAGYLWIGYIGGMLARFDPKTGDYQFFMNDAISQVGSFYAAAKDPITGTLYFGGVNGFLSFNPKDIPISRAPPRAILTSLEIYNQPVFPGEGSPLNKPLAQTSSLTLDHSQNDVSLGFVGLDYEDPDGILYDYQLIPYDADWRGITPQRTATYTALPPGEYTFQVRTRNRSGIWNEALTTLDITIRPPWWRTLWAYFFYGFVGFMALVGLDRIRRHRLLQRERKRIQERELEQAHQLKVAFMELESAHIALEEEKKKTEAQAGKLRELDQAKNRFFANVSHEFRTPLTLTIGPLEDLVRDGEPSMPPRAKSQIDLAIRNAYRVLDLINEILDVAKLESGRLDLQAREQNLAAFIQDRSQAFSALAERKQITYTLDKPDLPILVHFDATHLEKVVANLLSNAFKFTPENGAILVTVGTLANDEGDDRVFFSVRDNGPGIPKADLPHVFDRFHQVNETSMRLQPGTGIGLALVKQLVDRHGGEISVESRAGFGSTFTVFLRLGTDHFDEGDLATTEATQDFAQLQPGPALQRAERLLQETDAKYEQLAEASTEEDITTILVVEDNADVRTYVSRHLSKVYRVIEASNGKEGLVLAQKLLPDLIVSDIMMPEMDGHEFCKAIKNNKETAFIPVVLLTARATTEDKVEGLKGGADDYITKPFDIQELVARVNNLIASRQQLLALSKTDRPSIQLGDVDVSSLDEVFLEQVRDTIEAHIGDESFSVEIMADALNMDRSSLFRRLRAIAGQSPAELIWTLRLERAAQLLEARAGSVSEIAYSVGFKSVAHFSRRFQKQFTVPPSKYKGP